VGVKNDNHKAKQRPRQEKTKTS